jgi:hypothetical protein
MINTVRDQDGKNRRRNWINTFSKHRTPAQMDTKPSQRWGTKVPIEESKRTVRPRLSVAGAAEPLSDETTSKGDVVI